MRQIQDIINQVTVYSLTDPKTLLPWHRDLLDVDFGCLGEGPSSQRLVWLANMDSAMGAATLSEAGTLSTQAVEYFGKENVTRSESSA